MRPGMTMYSFHTYAMAGKIDVRGFIEFAAGVGLDGIDLVAYYWKDERTEPQMALELVNEKGLRLHAYAVGDNFLQDSRKELQKHVDIVRRGIETAYQLQAPVLRIFGGHNPQWPPKDARLRICEAVEKVLEEAEQAGIVLAMENHGSCPATAQQVIEILDTFNNPFLRACVDIGNFWPAGQPPVEGTKQLAPYAAHVHIKDLKKIPADNKQGYELAPSTVGAGDVDIKGCLQALKDNGYTGGLAIEAEGPEDDMEAAIASVDHLKSTLEQLS